MQAKHLTSTEVLLGDHLKWKEPESLNVPRLIPSHDIFFLRLALVSRKSKLQFGSGLSIGNTQGQVA